MSQSSNDIFPSAMHVSAALALEGLKSEINTLADIFHSLEAENTDAVKTGRTHLQDATPITFSEEISGWRASLIYVDAEKVVPAIFTLAVFIVSYWTDGYVCGILMATMSVLVLNFAFTFPFFAFNFTIQENLISAVIMLVITIMSSTLTSKVKQQEKMKTEHEKERMRANLLRAVSHDLRTPLTTIYGSSAAICRYY